jgi:AcrR family transcriptional regulator
MQVTGGGSMTEREGTGSVWTRPNRRREQPALSREQIVAEAVRLLDADGLDALSMRKLGTRLGAGATSLYWHVGSKEQLLELVADEVYAEFEVPTITEPARWREAATAAAHSLRGMIRRHPWLGTLLGGIGLSYLGPNVMRTSDRTLALFEAAGFTLAEADAATSTLGAYVIGVAITEAAWLTALARSGRSEREWADEVWPAAREAAESYPALRRLYALSTDGGDPQQIREGGFDYGLDRVLDGLEGVLHRRRTSEETDRAKE